MPLGTDRFGLDRVEAHEGSSSAVPVAFVIVHTRLDAVGASSGPLTVYTHLIDGDHAETMAALEAMSQPTAAEPSYTVNVVPPVG